MKKNQPGENAPDTEVQPEEYVTFCGGIKPILIFEPEEEETEEK